MTHQHIDSTDISVGDLFKSFYVVPDYQREYVWGTEQVEQLLTDISDEMSGHAPEQAPEYFIGSIVVCPGVNGVLDLIDGQQRMTTLYVILCAIRDRLKTLGQGPISVLNSQLYDASIDASGKETQRHRLELQYDDSGNTLTQIADSNPSVSNQTRSMENINNAHSVALQFLKEEMGSDSSAVRQFYGYLNNKVKLIRIQTEDIAKALKIFETINDRGIGLNSMDLLKNLLFMKAEHKHFDQLKDKWKSLQDKIFSINEKPLRFLRYFIFSRYDVDVLREDEIYAWLSKNDSKVGYSKDPVRFTEDLVIAARTYAYFKTGHDQHGERNRYLDNMRLLGGQAARQHLILLLAGTHLKQHLFDLLAKEVENLFFCYVITREPTRNFERNFASWANEVRAINTDEQFNQFVTSRFKQEKSNLSTRFNDALERLAFTSLQQYRLRYLLSKMTQHVDISAYGETEGTRWLDSYMKGGYEIEHIFPNNPSEEARNEFGPYEDPEITQRLGNLVLVEKSINASLGNRPYSEKHPVYRESKLLLTRALAERPSIGSNTRIDRAVTAIHPYPTWTPQTVNRRQSELTALAKVIWELPN